MQATIDTMFVNKRLSEYIYFFHSHHETRQMHFKRSIVTITSQPVVSS